MENTEAKKEEMTTRKSIICTFTNHPPIRLWGEFTGDDGKYLDDFEDGCLWNARKDFGHHEIDYYICKSGKRIYWASYNSGCSYGNHEPRTTRKFLKDTDAIKNYLCEVDPAEWHRVCHKVDPSLIVDSDLL